MFSASYKKATSNQPIEQTLPRCALQRRSTKVRSTIFSGTVMRFRQNNKQMREAKLRWDVFCTKNRELIERIGLPTPTIETEERFEDLLMHGYIDHHGDWSGFRVDQLDEGKYKLFKRLVEQYFAAGYDDPGLMAVEPTERERLAVKYPQRFV
jgi:hypothetical protein